TPAAGLAVGAKLQLRWAFDRDVFDAAAHGGHTLVRLILTNRDSRPLPAQGWSLYFNCMDAVTTGPLAGGLALEQIAAGLYRLRPDAGFAGLAPGATLDIEYGYPSLLTKLAKAPVGPYLVYDAAPEVGIATDDYQL